MREKGFLLVKSQSQSQSQAQSHTYTTTHINQSQHWSAQETAICIGLVGLRGSVRNG